MSIKERRSTRLNTAKYRSNSSSGKPLSWDSRSSKLRPPKEQEFLRRALELDPNDSDARAWLGFLKWQPFLDWRGAEAEFRQAIFLSPNNAEAHHLLGLLLVTLGRVNEGLQESQIAQQLDPNHNQRSL